MDNIILYHQGNGLRWGDALKECVPHNTIYNRFIRWIRFGVFNRISVGLAKTAGEPDQDHA